MRFCRGAALALSLCATGASQPWSAPEITPDQFAALLLAMHPDYQRYIGSVRYGSSRLRPATLYAGLVRRGGVDPRDPDDGPVAGRGTTYDVIVYADTFEPWRSLAWRRLVADHEYFHARHLAHGLTLPVVGFGEIQADTDYYEALAWGHNLEQANAGAYGELAEREGKEAAARYLEHRDRFHSYVMRRQPSAWAHYGRFLQVTRSGSDRPEAPPPAAAPEPR